MRRGSNGDESLDVTGIAPISIPRLSDTIADQIRDLIVSQDLKEGTRLPSERLLAERFGTSRPTVSQAIRTLSLMGLVESRRGSGAYVLRRPDQSESAAGTLLTANADNLEHLLELRLWLEGLGVQQAIERGPEGGIAKARQALQRLTQSVGETSTWIAADTLFHATLVDLVGNPVLTRIYEQAHTSLLEYEYKEWVENDEVPAWLAPAAADEQMALHEPIVDALERGDVDAALAAVRRHNDVMREHLLSRSAD
ncbi:FadR/GntR family transcriptional regulator [Streptomyces sp. NPDC093085]|uniref:FadR/GntR family transcriptional regulator n=1 Tax=Streptomyces sp. NPDC093085 TaxID=3155068 RepID=UPI00342965A6